MTFVLASSAGVLIGDGVAQSFDSVADAQAALHSGGVPIVVGALPFDLSGPAALTVPREVRRTSTLPDWPREVPAVRIARTVPAPHEHRGRIQAALDRLRATDSTLHKVVLARALELTADGPIDARAVVARLATADSSANAYLVDLSSAGTRFAGTTLVGASPDCWSPAAATPSPASRSPARRPGPPTPRSTARTARRWPRRRRTSTNTNWWSTRCARRSIPCASISRSPRRRS